jgi:hypothetical protein
MDDAGVGRRKPPTIMDDAGQADGKVSVIMEPRRNGRYARSIGRMQ